MECTKKINYDKLTGSIIGVKSLFQIESISTDFVTHITIGNDDNRFSFYQKIIELYKIETKKSTFLKNNKDVYDNMYFIFKGGNIIKLNVNSFIINLNKTIISDSNESIDSIHRELKDMGITDSTFLVDEIDFNYIKRNSDADVSIYIDFYKIFKFDRKMDLTYVINKIWKSSHAKKYISIINEINAISKKILTKIRDEVANNMHLSSYMVNKYLNIYNKSFEKIKAKTIAILKKTTYEPEEYVYLMDENIYIMYKNILKSNLSSSLNEGFDKENKYPQFCGICLNSNTIHTIDGFSDISKNNCMSLNNLLNNKTIGADNRAQISDLFDDPRLYDYHLDFCNDEGHLMVDDSIFYNNFEHNTKMYGFNDKNERKPFKSYSIYNTSKDKHMLYISCNNTIRISRKYIKNLHSLNRIKYNIRLYFAVPHDIIIGKSHIKYIFFDVPGEYLDVTVPLLGDYDLFFAMKDPKKSLTDINLKHKSNHLKITTYSFDTLIHNLYTILFYQTIFTPWRDKKYSSRCKRLIYLILIKCFRACKTYNDMFLFFSSKNNTIKVLKKLIDIVKNGNNIMEDVYQSTYEKVSSSHEFIELDRLLIKIRNTIINNEDERKDIILFIEALIKYINKISYKYEITFKNNIDLTKKGNSELNFDSKTYYL